MIKRLFRFHPTMLFLFAFVAVLLLPKIGKAQRVQSSLANQLQERPVLQAKDPVQLKAEYKLLPGSRKGNLIVKAKVADGWHTYSITQKPGGPIPSKLTVAESKKYRVGKFKPLKKPTKAMDSVFNMEVEKHKGSVTWVAPVELADGVDPKSLKIKLVYNGGACESRDGGTCVPIFDVQKSAAFGGFDANAGTATSKLKLTPYQPEGLHAKLTGRLFHPSGGNLKPGTKVKLAITVQSDSGYHVYGYDTPESKSFSKSLIQFTQPNVWKLAGPTSSSKPKVDSKTFGPDNPVYYHETTTWTFELVVPNDPKVLQGQMTLQTCTDAQCDQPVDIDFSIAKLDGSHSEVAIQFSDAKISAKQLKPAQPKQR